MSSTISIEEATDRPWIVMVHGMSQDHRHFARQIEAFRAHFRILLIDLPGHGLSSNLGGPFGHAEFAAHVVQLLDTPRFGQVHYWGTHTGGTIGVMLGLRRPDLLRSLLLESPLVPGSNPPVVSALLSEARARARNLGVAAAIDYWWREGCWFDQVRDAPVTCRAAEQRAIINGFSGTPWLDETPAAEIDDLVPAETPLPALVYQGTLDHSDFVVAAEEVCRLLPGSEHRVIPKLGGFPSSEDPHRINALAKCFSDRADHGAV